MEKQQNYNVDYAKKYYLKNKEKILKYQKEYYDENNTHRKKRQDKKNYQIKKEIFIIKFN
jgi:hypothetical protein